MYGLVNQGIKDLVISHFGQETWNQLCTDAEVPNEFLSMHYYDDSVTYKLVGSASKLLNTPAEEILKKFGIHWVKFTGQEGYGPIMDLFGSDFKSCLKNLNHLHTRMGMTLPHLRPPSFDCVELSENKIEMTYTSEREGLVPMVIGLLSGLADKHNTKISITTLGSINKSTKLLIEILR